MILTNSLNQGLFEIRNKEYLELKEFRIIQSAKHEFFKNFYIIEQTTMVQIIKI